LAILTTPPTTSATVRDTRGHLRKVVASVIVVQSRARRWMKKPFFDLTLEERLQQTTIGVRFIYCREKVNLAPIFS
jgi:hypothetical protein